MLRRLALLIAPCAAVALAAPTVAAAEPTPSPESQSTAEPPLPPTPPLPVAPRKRRARFTLGAMLASPHGDLDGVSTGNVDLQRSTGLHFAFGYPADSAISFLIDLRYLFLEIGDSSLPAGTDFTYYDLGLGARYTLAIGDTTDFLAELLLLSSTLKLAFDDFGSSTSKSGVGLLMRAGVVLLATARRSFIVTGSYSLSRVDSSNDSFDGDNRHSTPKFLSVEFAVEWKL